MLGVLCLSRLVGERPAAATGTLAAGSSVCPRALVGRLAVGRCLIMIAKSKQREVATMGLPIERIAHVIERIRIYIWLNVAPTVAISRLLS